MKNVQLFFLQEAVDRRLRKPHRAHTETGTTSTDTTTGTSTATTLDDDLAEDAAEAQEDAGMFVCCLLEKVFLENIKF